MLAKLWAQISHLGLRHCEGPLAQKRTILTNRISVITGLLMNLISLLDYPIVYPHSSIYWAEVIFSLSFFLVPFINYKGFVQFSKHFLIINLLFGSNVMGGIFSDLSHASVYATKTLNFALISLPFLLFESRQRISIAISSLFIIVSFFCAEYAHIYFSLQIPIDGKLKAFGSHYGFPLIAFCIIITTLLVSRDLDLSIILKLLKESQTQNIKLEEQKDQLREFNENLEDIVEKRTALLEEKNTQLERTYTQITDSLRYAKRIQEAMLGSPQAIVDQFKEAFIYFRPKDVVSGDFYWFAETRIRTGDSISIDGHQTMPTAVSLYTVKILIAADCTGHGVPGAFMTIMGHDLLNEIINDLHITRPDQILHSLDRRLSHSLIKPGHQLAVKDGMDMAVISLNEQECELLYAGAKNPLWYVRQGKIFQVPASNRHFAPPYSIW